MVMRVLAITCAIAIAAHSAAADRIGVVAMAPGRAGVGVAMAATAGAMPDALGEARAAIAGGAVPIGTLEQFRHVREQIDEAWRAYVRVQLDFAQSRLAAARTAAESLVALPGGAALYADAALRLGAVLGHAGRGAESQAILALALALDPERPITLAEFSPDVVSAVDAVRGLPRPSHDVELVTEPPGAQVSIDGKDVGRSPVTASIALGQHVVVARLPLYHARAQAIAVDDTTHTVSLDLDRDDEWTRLMAGPELGMSDAQTQVLADATVRYADLDGLVLVAASDRSGGPTLLVQRCAGLPARCTAIVEIGYADATGLVPAAREAWAAVRTADLRYPPSVFGDSRVTGPRVVHHCEWCRSAWLWGGVGAAAVIGTIAVIAVVNASRPPPIVGVNPGSF
jgi:hypothetical protein